jgi:hypothetical protein
MHAPHDQRPERQIDWNTIDAEMARITTGIPVPQPNGNPADRSATAFITGLEDVFSDFTGRPRVLRFERTTRTAQHIAELRRVLGPLTDLLAEWESIAGTQG